MQLPTLVLKEDNSLHYYKVLFRLEVHVKLLRADYEAYSYHLTVRACAGPKTLPIPFCAWITDWEWVKSGLVL